jgi:D-alanine-D-alanine ligase-like ATP-grasp enzyme
MIDLTRHPKGLRLLSLLDRAWAFVRGRGGGWRAAERNLNAFYERIWRQAAAAIGAEVENLGQGALEIRLGETRTRVAQNTTALDDLVTHRLVRLKAVMYRLLSRHGLPTPRYAEFDIEDMQPAVAFLENAKADCVVKPACDSGGGAGVATGIRTRWQLARAAYAAARFGGDLVIEEQVAGDNYRLLYLDGQLVDAVVRRPPTIVGDGRSTIARLVEQVNRLRLEGGAQVSHGLLQMDLDMKRTLAKQGLTFRSVPAKGAVVTLKTAINENAGADNETVTHLLADALIEEGARAATLAGVRLAGVDVITRDPSKSLADSGGVILEVNSPPGYYWHYHKRDGVCPVAVYVLEALLRPLVGGDKPRCSPGETT